MGCQGGLMAARRTGWRRMRRTVRPRVRRVGPAPVAVLLAAVALHLGLEYALNIPLFQWVMLSAYALFVEPADVRRAINWAKRRTGLGRTSKPESAPTPHHAGS